MIRPSPIFRILGKPLAKKLALLLLLVVAVFLVESFTTLMEEALQFGGDPSDVAMLLAFKAPEIMDLALAIGLLIALYFVLSEARNSGELIILASAGVRWTRIIGFAIWVGLAGGLLSFFVAGFLVPSAQFAEQLKMAELRSKHVLTQIAGSGPHNAILSIANTTFIATPPQSPKAQERGQLFVFQSHPDLSWRAIQSRDWTVIDAPTQDALDGRKVVLQDLYAYEGPKSQTLPPRPISLFRTKSADFAFRLQDVAPKPKAAVAIGERILKFSRTNERRIAAVGARALLVPAAALLAVAAVLAGGGGVARYVALPFAVVAVMAYDVLGRTFLGDALGAMSIPLLAVVGVLAYLGPALCYVLWRGEALMIPERGT